MAGHAVCDGEPGDVAGVSSGCAKEASVATYVVSDLGGDQQQVERVEGLTAAKLCAENRAAGSDVPVVVIERDTGRELARYPAGRQLRGSSSQRPSPHRPSDAVLRLRAANDRLRDNVEGPVKSHKRGS